jgi:hypothetical protein
MEVQLGYVMITNNYKTLIINILKYEIQISIAAFIESFSSI